MKAKFSQRLSSLSEGDISAIIQMAWEDRTTFETIQQRIGWSETDVIGRMRLEFPAHPAPRFVEKHGFGSRRNCDQN